MWYNSKLIIVFLLQVPLISLGWTTTLQYAQPLQTQKHLSPTIMTWTSIVTLIQVGKGTQIVKISQFYVNRIWNY